ncbi:MAG: alpha/beta fold hydrolase [Phenylobacterium sp.]|uniref:alpha/beta fold hydrolase n=1 Tax=Phenylobacterium sp. TaxID=1871053 RepID=UPI00271A67B4|nr:alpha/beta fold hydrolase [Phenylobacterium sp.]MDO8901960.1 alpha/beta fold hydrolase [Phenylobacterium sp.]MDP2214293.1 alpha/beta fold hydrolase [Phenylobacterium sp.]
MPSFMNSGVEIAFDDLAPGAPHQRTMVLVHGFTSNRKEGWRRTGWYAALERRGVRCIALDQRGHGESEKLYEPEAYQRAALASDIVALLDHLNLPQVDLFGYSMGARTALAAALAAPERISNLILGGVGERLLEPRTSGAPTDAMAEAMLAEDPETISHPMLRSFRHFADEQGEDRRALAAFVRAENPPLDTEAMGRLPVPVLVIAGQRDEGAGDPDGLARAFPEGRGITVVGCDHFSAIPHALTKAATFDFLDGLLDDPFADRY